ncbi:MAG TPA: two-component regulator propeller domain-containing protein, partial [bacterium]|nr:two-component regulator propeller domain-containing protein [bacterium]
MVYICYDSSNGMPQNSAVSFDQDSDRFIYIATQEGVVKFDGLNFEVFDRTNLKGLPSNLIRDIKAVQKDKIFVATSKGLVLYDRKAGIVNEFRNIGGVNHPDVISISYSSARNKLFGISNGKSLFSYSDSEGFDFIGNSEYPEFKYMQKVLVTKSDDVFVAGRDGVYFIDKTGGMTRVEEIDDSIQALAENREGYVFAGGKNGVYRIRNRKYIASLSEETGSEIKDVTALFTDSFNTLLIGMAGSGLYSYSGNSLKKINVNNTLNSEKIVSIYEDVENNLWIGTLSKGFCFAKQRRTEETFLRNELIMGITE